MTAYNRDGGDADPRLELLLGDSWADVTDRAATVSGISAAWTSGTSDASQAASPASLPVSLINDDGALTPGYPLSPWYGQIGQNTPARLSAAGAPRLWVRDTGSTGASCPDSAALHATGDIDIRVDCAPSDYSAIIAGKNPSWQLQFLGGLLSFAWSDGTHVWTAVCDVQPQPGRRCLRAVLTLSTGIVAFYTAAAGAVDGSTWTQLGDPVDAGSGATSVTTTGSLWAGAGTPGSFWEMRLLIAGAAVASPSLASQANGTTSFTDSHSNTWTIDPARAKITDRDWRMHGEVASNVRTSPPPLAALTIAGPLRRLQRGSAPPVLSPLRRAIEAQSGTLAPHAYWTWEDPAGSTQVSSDMGGPPMISDPARLPQFAADSSWLCSLPLPQLATTAIRGIIPRYTSHGSLVVRFTLKAGSTLGSPPAAGWPLVRVSVGGTTANLDLRVFSGYNLGIQGGNASGDVFNSGANYFDVAAGSLLYCSLELRPSGSTVDWALATVIPGGGDGLEVSGSYAGTVGRATSVLVHAGDLSDWVVGHLTVQSDWTSMFTLASPLTAWEGELAGPRFQRVCGENGYDARVLGAPAVTAAMGPQPIAPLATLLSEIQAADGGLLFEPKDSFSIGYRTLASMLNQAGAVTLDYAAGQIPPAPSATDDDLAPLVNDWTVSNSAGDSARLTLADGSPKSAGGAGTYADTATANVPAAQLPDVAGMLLARSTASGPRWPAVGADLGLLDTDTAAAAAGVLPGDVVALTSMPPEVAPAASVRLVATGATEQLGPGRSTTWNAAPAGPLDVIVMDDEVLGRMEADGAWLAGGASDSATTLYVATPDGSPALTTDAGDLPVDVEIAGEKVTVTAIAAPALWQVSPDGTFETTITGWFAQNGTLTADNSAAHTGSWSALVISAAAGNAVILSPVIPVAPLAQVTGSAWLYMGSSGITGLTGVDWYSDAAGDDYLSTSAGDTVSPAVDTWTAAYVTATAPDGAVSCRICPVMQATGAGEYMWADDVLLQVTAQALTVTRAVGGISKGHDAGEAVTLWTPPVLAPI